MHQFILKQSEIQMRPCIMNVGLFDFLIVYVFDQSVFSVIISCFEMSMTMEKQWQNA